MKESRPSRPRLIAAASWLLPLIVLGSCGRGAVELPPFDFLDPAPAPEIDAVVFLVGDAGDAIEGHSPLLARLTEEVEQWSRDLARDSAVSVVYLGDIIYPAGMHLPGEPEYSADSTRLWSQINVVAGPSAREHETVGWFLPGNHDWGQMEGDAGLHRIMNLDSAITHARDEHEINVTLVPPAGSPGPVVRDLRQNVRLVALDTHWFLQERALPAKDEFFERVTEALVEAGDREVILMAHHPFTSGGPHGALVSTTRALGLFFLLKKSGTLVQDLNSPVYRDFLGRLGRAVAFAERAPLIFAGGHDHSLQVITGQRPTDPRYTLVSGSASKVTEIRQVPNLTYAAERPGYMTLVFRRDDRVELYVTAGDPARLACEQADAAERSTCMTEGMDAFDVVYSSRLLDRLPAPDSTDVPPDLPPTPPEATQ